MTENPFLAVIGGSGLYSFPALSNVNSIEVDTPYGKPSSPIVIGSLSGRKVAFLARHGIGHILMPSEVNYRANIYALKSIGVQRVVSISACGSLREEYSPGNIVIPDQLVDLTRGRPRTFFGEGIVVHVGVADPYCEELRRYVLNAVQKTGAVVHNGGTYITIDGPRFSTKAESQLYRQWKMSIIGMTAIPEVFLAREAELCYATMAHVTDYDVWHVSEEPVTVDMVLKVLHQNTEIAQRSIQNLVEMLPDKTECDCKNALRNAILTQSDYIPVETRKKVSLFVDKYLK